MTHLGSCVHALMCVLMCIHCLLKEHLKGLFYDSLPMAIKYITHIICGIRDRQKTIVVVTIIIHHSYDIILM